MTERPLPEKSADAYRTISEVAEDLKLPQHVLRFWETRFPQVKPLKRAGGRRFYRPEDVALLRAIKALLYGDGYTIKGVQRMLQDQGPRSVATGPRRAGAGPEQPRPTEARQENGSAMRDDDLPSLGVPEPSRSGPPAPATRPPGTVPAQPAAARAPVSSDLVARLEALAFDLSECARFLALARDSGSRGAGGAR